MLCRDAMWGCLGIFFGGIAAATPAGRVDDLGSAPAPQLSLNCLTRESPQIRRHLTRNVRGGQTHKTSCAQVVMHLRGWTLFVWAGTWLEY